METEGKFKRCLKIVNDVLANATVGAGGVAAAAWLGDSSAGAKTLENAVAALEAAASQSSVEDSCQALPISGAVDALHALPAAVAALTSPHEDVFAALGGMPTEPQDEFAASGATPEDFKSFRIAFDCVSADVLALCNPDDMLSSNAPTSLPLPPSSSRSKRAPRIRSAAAPGAGIAACAGQHTAAH